MKGALALTVALGLALGATTGQADPAPAGEEVEVAMTPDAARALARQALADRRIDMALAIAAGLLAADPDDRMGLVVTAAAGEPGAAARAGRRAWRLRGTPEERFEAAFLTAQALTRGGQHERAKLWLRRAYDVAPDAAHEAAAQRAFLAARARSPLRLSVQVSAGPSDNVNGGSETDTLWLWGLPFSISGRLPGGTWSLGVQGGLRLDEGARHRTELTFGLGHRGVWLAERARAAAPEVRAADLSRSRMQAGLRHTWRPGEAPVVLRAEAAAGRQLQGGRAVTDEVSVSAGADWALRRDLQLSFGVNATIADHLIDPRRDAVITGASVAVGHALARGGSISLSLGLTDIRSDAVDLAQRGVRVGLGWRPGDLGPVTAEFSAGLEARHFPGMAAWGDDLQTDASATFGLPRAGRLGFTPEVTVSARRNRSDWAPRDSREIGVGFGLRSSF